MAKLAKGQAKVPLVETRRMALAELLPADYNPRRINDKAMKGLRASLERFGELGGIVYNEQTGRLVGGHQRVKALAALGVAEVEVRVVDIPLAEEKAANLALNHPGIGGEWDEGMLAAVLADVQRDLPTAFDELQLGDLWAEADAAIEQGEVDEDEVPELPAQPVTEAGDLWLLGDHRIICGSSTDADVVGRLLGAVKPHLMVTDPPYGVEYDPSWRAKAGINKNTQKMGKVLNDDKADWREAWALFPGDVAYVWHASMFTREVLDSLEACGFAHRSMIIWVKDRFTLGRGDYHWQHEPAWYVVKDGKVGHYGGGRSQSTVWNIPARDDKGVGHGTQKPVECMRRPIENNSNPGQTVYEPFSGSGTTIIAGEQTGRHVYAVELAPEYVDVAVQRWQSFTGKSATLDGDGRTFAEVKEARHGTADEA